MERRTFLALASGGLLATPVAAVVQPAGKVHTLKEQRAVVASGWILMRATANLGIRQDRSSALSTIQENECGPHATA